MFVFISVYVYGGLNQQKYKIAIIAELVIMSSLTEVVQPSHSNLEQKNQQNSDNNFMDNLFLFNTVQGERKAIINKYSLLCTLRNK